jgi:hypothetical protein
MPIQKTEDLAAKYIDAANDDFDIDARPSQSTSTAISSGWDAAEKLSAPAGDYPVEFKHSEDFQIIKILDPDGPFASYKLHFLQQKTSGKRSYVCLQTNCPLCDILKHRPEVKRAFTIANLSTNPVERQLLIATPRLYKTMHSAHFSPQGPLNKNFWAISRTGIKQTTVYHFNAVKGRDLEEDWNIKEATATAALAELECYDSSIIRETSYQDLLEIAESLS